MQDRIIYSLTHEELEELATILYSKFEEGLRRREVAGYDPIMTVTEIGEMIGVDRRNLHGNQKYLLPFTEKEAGTNGWRRSVVLAHLAHRDRDLKRRYEELKKKNGGKRT